MEFRWHLDMNRVKTAGFHPANGHGEVYISEEDLRAIMVYGGEVILTVETMAADSQGAIIHRILGIRPL